MRSQFSKHRFHETMPIVFSIVDFPPSGLYQSPFGRFICFKRVMTDLRSPTSLKDVLLVKTNCWVPMRWWPTSYSNMKTVVQIVIINMKGPGWPVGFHFLWNVTQIAIMNMKQNYNMRVIHHDEKLIHRGSCALILRYYWKFQQLIIGWRARKCALLIK